MKKQNWFELLLIIAIMAGAGYAAFSDAHNFPNRWFTRDDAYYYFKVAQNISEGNGITFDGVNLANGYHPLWMLICIPVFSLARFDLVLPLRILLLLMGALSAGTGVLLYRLVSKTLSKTVGALVAAFWGFSLYIHATVTQFGLETGITAFSIVLFLYLFEKLERKWRTEPLMLKEIAGFALVAVMVMFSRLDTVFLVVIFGFYLVFRAVPLRYLLPLDILGIVFLGFASFIFRVGMKEYYPYGETALITTLLSLAVMLPLYYFAGLYQHPRNESFFSLLKRVLITVTLAAGIVSALMLVLGRLGLVSSFPRSALLLNWGALLLWVGATRYGVRYLSAKRERDTASPLQLFHTKWKTWLNEGLAYYGIVGGALSLYMLLNRLLFGISSPVSGQIKRWWGSLPGRVYGGPAKRIYTFFGFDVKPDTDFNAWGLATKFIIWLRDGLVRWVGYSDQDAAYWQLFLVVGIIVLVILLADRKRAIRASAHFGLLPLFVGSVVQVISYHATGYSAAKEWYWVSQIIFTLLLVALLLDIFLRALQRIHPYARYLAWVGTAALIFVWGQAFYEHTAHLMPYGVENQGHPYMEMLQVIEDNTESGSLIGMTGGGNVGYFIADRTIVNMDGLINSYAYFQALQSGRAGEYLAEMGLDYVFVNPALLENIPYKGQFADRLGEPIANYRKKAVIEFFE
ncbi:MAG: hypothetical protein B5M51_02085 [Anaerolinea sp. 4484_236]|nr:MAG: hypothetical protein B5M51_02085 [Anaerolinea sp. 4484_236]